MFLKESGIDEPYKNAEEILSHLLKEPALNLYLSGKKNIPEGRIRLLRQLLVKRAAGIPLQYLTKRVCFYGCDLFVNRGVFIPRPETEMLVEEAVNLYKKDFSPGPVKILDIGTGSGNISVVLAREIKKCGILALDISDTALDAALLNARVYRVKSKIRFENQNCFPESKQKFHIIISNPPYISGKDMAFLPEEVKKEPVEALYGGEDGVAVIRSILSGAGRFLFDGGYLLMEMGCGQAKLIKNIPCNLELLAIKKDLSGIERYCIFKKTKAANG